MFCQELLEGSHWKFLQNAFHLSLSASEIHIAFEASHWIHWEMRVLWIDLPRMHVKSHWPALLRHVGCHGFDEPPGKKPKIATAE
jgi:hypothetical protein